MTQITASLIKQLREESSAGMMDCKKALTECSGDFEEAKDWLRKKGIAGAAKKASRVASEGLVAIATSGNKAAIVEVNSETDFVSKNEQFQKLVTGISCAALSAEGNVTKLNEAKCPESGKTVSEIITDNITTIGENLTLRRTAILEVSNGVVATYIHNALAPNMGKIGVIIALESEGDKEKLQSFGKQLAMHIAAAKPTALTRDEVDSSNIERERKIFADQAKQSGKPDNIIEKMVEGRIRKYYEEVVLPEQTFVIDGKAKVADAIASAEKDAGASIAISGFVQFTLGEGIEKQETDFAEEVAAAVGGA